MEESKYWSDEQISKFIEELDKYNSGSKVKVDMHNHTTGSDGKDSPLMLLLRAYNLGLETISITDHNTIKGYDLLIDKIKKILEKINDTLNNPNSSDEEKQQAERSKKRLYKILTRVKIVTGCEVLTIFKGCPYVEILAYDVDLKVLNEKLKEARKGLKVPAEVIDNVVRRGLNIGGNKEENEGENEEDRNIIGLERSLKDGKLKIDYNFIKYRNDYRALFYYEMLRYPENEKFYKAIIDKTGESWEKLSEEEKIKQFAEHSFDNPKSSFYVNLDNCKSPSERKKAIIEMIQKHESLNLKFNPEIINSAGGAAGLLYLEVMRHPENKELIKELTGEEEVTNKRFNYLGLYNEDSPFYVDLSETKIPIKTVIDAIHAAGGKAIVAHWGRYGLANKKVFDWTTPEGEANLKELIGLCDGAEWDYPDNPIDLRQMIFHICRENGKIISIGGDNHGKSSKEGEQYRLRYQKINEVEGLEWIRDSAINLGDFIKMKLEEEKYRNTLQQLIDEMKELEENKKNRALSQ